MVTYDMEPVGLTPVSPFLRNTNEILSRSLKYGIPVLFWVEDNK